MRVISLLLIFVVCSVSSADVLIKDSTSPDGMYSFYVTEPTEPAAMPDLYMKNIRTGMITEHFSAGGYYMTGAQMAEEIKVSWSPGSRWFVIRRRDTKRSRFLTFYNLNHGQPQMVKAPSYVQNVFGREKLVSRGRFLFEEPIGWGKSETTNSWAIDTFTLDVSGRVPDKLYQHDSLQNHYNYRVSLKLTSGDNATPMIRIVDVTKLSDPNQRLEPIVTTPAESGKAQSTQAHP